MHSSIKKYISDLKQLIERLKSMAVSSPDVTWSKRRAILETASYLHSKIRIATQFDFKYRRKPMIKAEFWRSNIKGVVNYYLAALPKQEDLADGDELRGIFLSFVLEKAKESKFEEIKDNLTPETLQELMRDCILAGAFMERKNDKAFYIRETFKKKDGEGDKKNEKKKNDPEKKKKKENVFS